MPRRVNDTGKFLQCERCRRAIKLNEVYSSSGPDMIPYHIKCLKQYGGNIDFESYGVRDDYIASYEFSGGGPVTARATSSGINIQADRIRIMDTIDMRTIEDRFVREYFARERSSVGRARD